MFNVSMSCLFRHTSEVGHSAFQTLAETLLEGQHGKESLPGIGSFLTGISDRGFTGNGQHRNAEEALPHALPKSSSDLICSMLLHDLSPDKYGVLSSLFIVPSPVLLLLLQLVFQDISCACQHPCVCDFCAFSTL